MIICRISRFLVLRKFHQLSLFLRRSGIICRRYPHRKTHLQPQQFLALSSTITKKKNVCNSLRQKSNKETAMDDYQHLNKIFSDMGDVATENANYFYLRQNPNHNFYKQFQTILNALDPLQISLEVVTSCCAKFDISPTCKGNGYRSIVNIVESCLCKVLDISKKIQKNRDKLFFRSFNVYMELQSYTQVLTRLVTISHLAIVLLDYSEPGSLFPQNEKIDDIMQDVERINRECFYGRSFGFQYVESMHNALQVVAVAMAAYGDGYKRHNHSFARALSSMIHSGKYVIDPELRAKRITELTQKEDIEFCKAFWSLTEEYGVQHAPLIVCPALAVNNEFSIPVEPLTINTLSDYVITVDLPNNLVGKKGIQARLLSYVWREGQRLTTSSKSFPQIGPKPSPKSRYLMLHCHGGGFVAQSSKSHEMYLRYWAKELKMPILSIDYSLAPAAPFPQAHNEIYFAYIWALQNLDLLGSTGEKICFSGDSAGANLVTSVCLRAIDTNIRLPDSLVVAYPPYRIQNMPSPSRILCLMDPLLPIGVLQSCIQAYTQGYRNKKKNGLNSTFYSDENYNPFDVDFRDLDALFPYNQFKLDHKHSFSESNLNVLKSKLAEKYVGDNDNESFYSDFPYSESASMTISETDDEYDVLSMKTDRDDSFSENPNKLRDKRFTSTDPIDTAVDVAANFLSKISGNETEGNKDVNDLFLLFKDQVSSTVNDITSGVTNYLLGTIDQDSSESESSKENSGAVENVSISNSTSALWSSSYENKIDSQVLGTPTNSRKRNANDDPEIWISNDAKVKFEICKECLHRSDQCLCHKHPKSSKPLAAYHCHRLNSNYRSSSHHISDKYVNDKRMGRTSSLTLVTGHSESRNLPRTKSDSDSSLASSSPPKNPETSGFETGIVDNEDKNIKGISGDTQTVKVFYDKSSDQCIVVTPTVDKQTDESHSNNEAFEIGKNPYLSPYLASDDTLKKLPPTTIVACSLDPLFDDSIEFVRRLHKLGNLSTELYVVDKLPHGFLNFQVFSDEAREGCDLLIACIKKSLGMGMRRTDSSAMFNYSVEKQVTDS